MRGHIEAHFLHLPDLGRGDEKKAEALSSDLFDVYVVGDRGLEPPTSSMSTKRSSQLS